MSNSLFPSTHHPIKVYWSPVSGHAHRVTLFLSLLDIPFETILVDLKKGEHKEADYLQKHPFGQVPMIDDNGTLVWDSNAILIYLAKKYDGDNKWLPESPIEAARVQQWLSVAASQLYNGPATARVIKLLGRDLDYDLALAVSKKLLRVLENELESRAFLIGETPSLADIALYSYTFLAPEGEIDLTPYKHINAWLNRIEALEDFLPMQLTPKA